MTKFKPGQVWSREWDDREQIFTVEKYKYSPDYAKPILTVRLSDHTRTTIPHPHSAKKLKVLGYKCEGECGLIMFGATEPGFCETCRTETCEACQAEWPRVKMLPGELDGEKVWYCRSCAFEPDPDAKKDGER